MTDQWYIARDGQTFGPYAPEQVKELARIQPLLPTDQRLRAGTFTVHAPVSPARMVL